MALFSRSFVRKRIIALATTALVAATSFAFAENPPRTNGVRKAIPIQYVVDRSKLSEEQPFLSENATAMDKMMADMTIKPTGDAHRVFVAMLVPHHQGAFALATADPHHGHHKQPP